MRRVRLFGSMTALSLAHVIKPKPRLTPHSTIEPLTGMTLLNSSYSAIRRVRCWRRMYFGKFSIRTSTGSEEASKTFSISLPTIRSWAERNDFTCALLRDIGDPASLATPLDARLFRAAGRVVARRRLQRAHQLVGATVCGQVLEAGDGPIEVLGAECVRRNHLHDRGVVGRPRSLVRPQQLLVQSLARAQSRVDDLDVLAWAQAPRAHQRLGQ